MARSFFPDLPGPARPVTRLPTAASGGSIAAALSSPARLAWLAHLLLSGTATLLALIFAGLWWHSEIRAETTRLALNRTGDTLARITSEQSRQRRHTALAATETASRFASLTGEAATLRHQLDKALAASGEADRDRQSLSAQIEQLQAAARQRAASLSQEQYRSVTLEQNLVLTQNDLTRHTVDHEQHIDSLQSSLGILRDTVVQRETEIHTISSIAQDEISQARQAAETIALQAEWLDSQLRAVTCERDRLQAEVHRLQQCLESERQENQRLRAIIHQLECRVRELESRPKPDPSAPQAPAPLP